MTDKHNTPTPDPENPEWTDKDFAKARPADEVVPKIVARYRGKQKAPTKKQVTVRLDSDLVDALKEGGSGWQTRMNAILREAILSPTGKKKSRNTVVERVNRTGRISRTKSSRTRKKTA